MTEGATFERHQHSKISLDKRTLTEGGLVLEYGNRDLEHCYLDFLRNEALLGNEPDATARYDTGYKLRELYFECHASAKSMTLEPRESKSPHTTEGEIGDSHDLAMTKYSAVVRGIPMQYRDMICRVCVENPSKVRSSIAYHQTIINGLDSLYGVFRHVEGK